MSNVTTGTGIVATIEADLKTWFGEAETDLEAAGAAIWGVVKGAAEAVGPQLLADLTGLFSQEVAVFLKAGVDLSTGAGVGKLTTNVLNVAEAAGKTAVAQVTPAALNAAAQLAILAAAPAVTAPAPAP